MIEPETKTCLECGRDVYGRVDKKFCTDACRSAFNNKNNGASDDIIRKINRKLKKNRLILETFNVEGKTRTNKEKLQKEGFDFDLITETYRTKEQKEYRFCYDQGYLELSNNLLLLVKRGLSD